MRTITVNILLLLISSISLSQDLSSHPGRSVYVKSCSSCHGINMQGGNAQSLADAVWQFGEGRWAIANNIKYGIQHLGMPGYEKTLSERQINDVVDFLLKSEKASGAVKPPLPEEIQTMDYEIKIEKYAEGLEVPWSIDFIDKDNALITERPGRLRVVQNGKLMPEAVSGTPEVLSEGQGGLLDVAVDPDYSENGWIYLSYSHKLDVSGSNRPPAMTRLVRGRIEGHRWVNQQVIYEAPHDSYLETRHHYGCRISFDPQGYLYFSIGERGMMEHAQLLDRPNGKIHRINRDGSIPKDNPFVNIAGALPTIYTFGNRNPQGMAVHPQTGQIWASEHGPLGGDELNLIEYGKNYGWPVISYGKNYDGSAITRLTEKPGMEQPVFYWKPSTAVCGMDFYSGDMFPLWKDRLLVGALKYEDVRVLNIKNNRVIHEQVIVKNLGRVRDVACGPDGAIYVVLNQPGTVLRLIPK